MDEKPWKEAVAIVLSQAGQALHYKQIAEEIEKLKLRRNLGATPANTVYVALGNSIKNEGEKSPFIKVGTGIFMLRGAIDKPHPDSAVREDVGQDGEEKRVVKCVGMYWNASKIIWKSKPRLLGQEQQGSKEIDFCDQVGIYLLYDRSRVIYVGRSVDRPLGVRLSEHTRDRLNGRWDRFSWFGLRGVDNSGKLVNADFSASQSQIISLMEAILIESLEPPQNRKRGDDFSDIEYLQVADKEKQAQRQKALISMLTETDSEEQ